MGLSLSLVFVSRELSADRGQQMKQSVEGVAEMLAVGLGLPSDAFTSHAKYGAHLLAPTATSLERHGQLDTIFAGFHKCARVIETVVLPDGSCTATSWPSSSSSALAPEDGMEVDGT